MTLPPSEDFNWRSVFTNLDGDREPDEDRIMPAIRVVIAWIIGDRLQPLSASIRIGIVGIILGQISGYPEVCRLTNSSKALVNHHVRSFERRFGFRPQACRSATQRRNMPNATTRVWGRRKGGKR